MSDGGSLDGQHRSRVLERADGLLDPAPGRPDERLEVSGHSGVEPTPPPAAERHGSTLGRAPPSAWSPTASRGTTVRRFSPSARSRREKSARWPGKYVRSHHCAILAASPSTGSSRFGRGWRAALRSPSDRARIPESTELPMDRPGRSELGIETDYEPSPPRVGSARLVDDVRHRLRDRRVAEQRLRAVRLTAGRRRCRGPCPCTR